MGRIFLEHINGTQKLYNCGNCDTNLTNKSQLISTRYEKLHNFNIFHQIFFINQIHWIYWKSIFIQEGCQSNIQ